MNAFRSFRFPTARTCATAVAVAALTVVATSACSSDSTTATASSTTAVATSEAPEAASAPSATPSPDTAESSAAATPAAEGQVVAVSVAGGKVKGPSGRVKIKKDSTVTLKVTSDVADEIHLHGYDKSADVEKGGTATLTFQATLTGVFEVELEERGLQLVQLQVQ